MNQTPSPSDMRVLIERALRPVGDVDDATEVPAASDHDLGRRPAHVEPLKPAAVLVPLVERVDGYHLLLTQRSDHLHDHAGQISFPGGRSEAEDRNAIVTALRESEEEIGLERRFVEVAGLLDLYETGSRYLVTPVVGFVSPGFALAPDPFEVAEVFEVPLEFVLDDANRRTDRMYWKGSMRRFYVYQYDERKIWGATAGILVNFARRVSS